MKKVSKIWQRVMALALVLMMVLSYVPTGVVAEGEVVPQQRTAVLMAASLTETANYGEATGETEESGDPVTPEIVSYTYELKVWNDEKDLQDEVTKTTVINGNSISGVEIYTVPVGTSFEIQVSYQGLELKLSNSEVTNGSVEKSIVYTYMDIHEVTQYTAVNLDALKPSDVDGAEWTFVHGEQYSTYVVGNVYTTTTETDNAVIGEYVLKNDQTELAKVPVEVAISAPDFDIALTGADGNAWYNTTKDAVVVTVTATASAELAAMPEKLPAITAEDATIGEWAWNTENKKVFTNTITITETTTVNAGDQSLTVNVDNEPVVITAVDSYVNNKGTVVLLAYDVGDSHVVAVKVVADGQTYTFDNLDNPSQVLLEGVAAKTVSTVTVTNDAGVESAAYPPAGDPAVDVTAAIAIDLQIPKIGVAEGKTYIKEGTVMDVTISNVSDDEKSPIYLNVENITVAFDDKDGAEGEKTVNWTYSNGAYTGSFVVNDGDKNIKVIAKGANDRTTEKTDGRIYACDTEAPSISIDTNADGDKAYENKELTYVVTIADNAYLDLSAIGTEASISVSYVINGETKNATASKNAANTYVARISVIDGEKLESISVVAKDNTGNANSKNVQPNVTVDTTKPVITAAISAKNASGEPVTVSDFYKKQIGKDQYKWFAVVDPVETDADNGTITLTVIYTLAEVNPDANALTKTGWNKNTEGVWTKTVSAEVSENNTGVLDLKVTAIDLAENVPNANIVIKGASEDSFVINLEPNNGQYSGTISIDRRTPGTGTDDAVTVVPVVRLKPSVNTDLRTANGDYLYNAAFNYTFTVTDASAQGEDSGVKSVEWMISGNVKDFLSCSGSTTNVNEEITIPVEVIGAGEANDVTLEVIITDNVGNKFVKVQEFAFDNLAPRVAVFYEDKGTYKNENFFNAPRIATITYTDINLDVAQYTKDGVTADATVEQVVEYTSDGHHTLGVYAKDLANNEIKTFDSTSVAPDDFYIDTKKPVVTIMQDTEDANPGVDAENNIDYYDKVVTYTIRVDDEYMDAGAAWVMYEKTFADGASVEETVDLLSAQNRETQIEIGDGEALTMLQVYACDNADWKTELDTEPDDIKRSFAETEEDGVYQFDRITAVDMTPAEVSLIKTGECVRTMDNVDYYDDVVTYDLTITDRYLLNIGTVEVNVDYNGEQEDKKITLDDLVCDTFGKTAIEYTGEFKVENGSDIQVITILVKDNAGNITKTINVGEDKLTSFEYKDGLNQYTGNRVVVDMTAPNVEMTLSKNVKAVYTNDDVIYLELEEPAIGESGIFASQNEQTAGITVTVSDKNIALLKTDIENGIKGSVETVRGKGEWSGTPTINTDSKLEYKEDITVKADKTGAFTFKLRVFDLADNPVNVEKIVVKAGEENNYTSADVKVENGEFGSTISVDRRRPSSVDDDTKAPVISIVPSLTATTASNGKELYNNAVNFALTVTDGEKNEHNSGIRTVDWVINDAVDFVKDATVTNAQQKGTYTQNFTIPVAVNGVGESNDVSLTISAIDNVGNTTTYTREFAVDNQAPRVAVNYDNNDVRNEKYFKANRTATITVTDINFNADTTVITTQVTPTAWEQNGGTWTCKCIYATDGEYTFSMESVDLAKNFTADAAVDYADEAAPKDFVIDKTAPVITVTYNPSSPVGKDNEGVDYYADELNATVSIREVNFRASDVDAKFNSNNSLSGFSSSGNIHTARETFGEGNKYKFSVDYTDLAGNAAVGYDSPVFSVDLTAPTIEITEGTMTNDKLNIVQDDMVLGFTINDAQSNLKNYSVKVTHLNNEFKTEEVEGADYYSISTVEERTTVRVDFANIAAEKGKDGIYTVQITAQDYAGNTVSLTPELLFSLNRFGSTFYTDDPFTQDFLVPSADGAVYQQLVGQKLIFKEINPNQVWQDGERSQEGSVLTIVVNGTTRVLTEGVDYTVSAAKEGVGDTKWYVYTYEVDPAIFADGEGTMDGRYSLLFYSEDEAGNKNTNESNEFGMIQLGLDGEYTGKVEFTLDDTTPIISTVGIESEGSYDAENQKLSIFLSDNTPVSIFVKLNGQSIDLAEATGANNAAWLIWDDAEACYVLNVPEKNTLFGRQNVEIKVTDAAGNVAEAEITDFTVSSNLFVRFVNSIWFWITCAVLALLILLIIVLVKRKQQKKIAA